VLDYNLNRRLSSVEGGDTIGLGNGNTNVMANRNIQQKMLKMKRRNRYAVFSGASTKYAERVDIGKVDDKGRHVRILVGPVSLSNQVISTGRGPDSERMKLYYDRIHSFGQKVPPTLGASEPLMELINNYKETLKRDNPRLLRTSLVKNITGTLDLFFEVNKSYFFVEVDYKKKIVKRSQTFRTKEMAMLFLLELKKVKWVEVTSPP